MDIPQNMEEIWATFVGWFPAAWQAYVIAIGAGFGAVVLIAGGFNTLAEAWDRLPKKKKDESGGDGAVPDRIKEMVEKELERILRERGLSPEEAAPVIKEAREAAQSSDPMERKAAEQLVNNKPEDAYNTYIEIAEKARAEGDIDRAVQALIAAAAFALVTNLKKAERAYEDALELKPNAQEPASRLAFIKLAQGDSTSALKYAQMAVDNSQNESERAAAHVALSDVLIRRGDIPRASEIMREAVRTLRKMVKDAPADNYTHRRLAEALIRLGTTQAASRDIAAARKSYEEGYAILYDALGREPNNGDVHREYIAALDRMAGVLAANSEYSSALEYSRVAEEFAKGLADANPSRADIREEELAYTAKYASLLRQGGRLHDALPRVHDVLAGYQKIAARPGQGLQSEINLRDSYRARGEALEQAGDLDTALKDARQTLALTMALRQKAKDDIFLASDEVDNRRWVADLEGRCGNLTEARAQCDKAMADAQALKNDALIAQTSHTSASLRMLVGDTEGAAREYQVALTKYQAVYLADPSVIIFDTLAISCRIELGELAARTGDMELAARTFDECMAAANTLEQDYPDDFEVRRNAAWVRYRFGERQLNSGDARGAVKALTDAHARYAQITSEIPQSFGDKTSLVWAKVSLCEAKRSTGALKEARALAEEARVLATELRTFDDASVAAQELFARSFEALANVESSEGRLQTQLGLYREAVKVYLELAKRPGAGPPAQRNLAYGHANLGLTLTNLARLQEAVAQLEQGRAIRQAIYDSAPTWEAANELIDSHLALASALEPTNPALGLEHVAKASALADEVLARTPALATLQHSAALVRQRGGDLTFATGDVERARLLYEDALARFVALQRVDRANAMHTAAVADNQINIGECRYIEGSFAEARAAFEQGLAGYDALLQAGTADYWTAWARVLPEFRIAQMDKDDARQRACSSRLHELEKEDGRNRVGLHMQWLKELRALAAEGA